MSTRQAGIRLTLNSGSFTGEMRSLTGRVAASGRMMGSALSAPLNAGLASAKRSLADMGSSFKNTIKSYGTLATTIAAGLMTKNAVELQGLYRNLAFDIAKLNGDAVTWRDVQTDVNEAAGVAGQRAKDMAGAYSDVYRATGDLDYTRQTLEAIGVAATASGDGVTDYATAAQMMMRKFNITAKEVPDAMAKITQQVNSGALGLDGLNSRFGMLAGEAKLSGMVGVSGMTDLLGLFRLLDSELGEKLTPALTVMFQTMKAGSTYAKEFKKVGVEFKPDMSFKDKFKQLLQGKGRIIAEEKFTGFGRNAFDLLAKPFDEAMEEAQDKGMKKAAAVDYALAKLDAAFKAASDTTWDYAELQRRAKARMASDPTVKLRMAMQKMEMAFSQPKMIKAIETLADKLPILAEKLADLIDWAANNPWKAAGVVGAAKIGVPALSAAIGTAGGLGLKALGAKALGGGAAAAAGGAATTSVAGAAGAGAAGVVGVGAGAALAVAGAAAAGGGLIGYDIYRRAIKPKIERHFSSLRDIDELLLDADKALSSKKIDLTAMKAVMAAVQTAQSTQGPSGLMSFLSAGAKAYGADIDSAEKQRAKRMGELAEAEMKLTKRIEQFDKALAQASYSVKKLGSAAEPEPGKAGPGTSRGVKPPSNNWPGAVPVTG